MIVDIVDIKDRFHEIENLFPNVFTYDSISRDLENNPFSHYLVYLLDNKIIGFINYYFIYDRVEIANFNILEQYQNNHYGSKLLEEVIMRSIDKKNITLEVRCDNNKAIKIYQKYGFKKKAIRKNYYHGIDGILMEKEMNNMKKDIYVLGIESSCDETSISIIKNGIEEISTVTSTQIDIHKDYGGVVPEIASRNHIKNVTIVLEECLNKANMTMDDIDAIAVTYGPGLIGSLLVGLITAKTLSFIHNKPLIPVNHIAGHIYANSLVEELKFPLLAVVVSGGHTELILMEDHYKFKKLGGTLDDAIGECYDKVARIIGLEYPGGPKLDKLAKEGKNTYNLPIPKQDNTYDFSFSGLKSAVINLVHNEEQRGNEINKADLAASFQKVAVESVVNKIEKAIQDNDIKMVIVARGVAANTAIREEVAKVCEKENVKLSIPDFKYCTDNGTMIAAAGYYAYLDGRVADLKLNSVSQDKLA